MNIINYLSKSENSVAILLSTAVLSMVIPYGFPLFGILTAFFVAIKLVSKNIKIRINTGFYLFLACALFYILGTLWNNGVIYSRNKVEIINLISFLLIWILVSGLQRKGYIPLIRNFAKYVAFICLIASILSFYKFKNLIDGVLLPWVSSVGVYPSGTSLTSDYNMFSFGLFTGALMALYLLNDAKTKTAYIYYSLTSLLCFSSIVLAGSRRGWVILIFVGVILVIKLIQTLRTSEKARVRFVITSFLVGCISLLSALVIQSSDSAMKVEASQEFYKLQYRFETLQTDNDNAGYSGRTDRWKYAFELMSEYNLAEISFGTGFGYLPVYAEIFAPDIEEDYPHNPIISALLFSGVVGTVFLIALLVWSLYMTITNRKVIGFYFASIYVISWFYIFISSNSIFSVKLFILLLLIIISIPRKENDAAPI